MSFSCQDLKSAANFLKNHLQKISQAKEDFCLSASFSSGDIFSLLKISATPKFFYQSRDQQKTFIGIGAADQLQDLSLASMRAKKFSTDFQIYFGALRFCDNVSHSVEWQSFGKAFFIMPIVLITITKEKSVLTLNFCVEGKIPFKTWVNQAHDILNAMQSHYSSPNIPKIRSVDLTPSKTRYLNNVSEALETIRAKYLLGHKKIVLGRRRKIVFENTISSCDIFLRLLEGQSQETRFFIDNPVASFFGRSPELLYKRIGTKIFTEAIAGTRPRGTSDFLDEDLAKELLNSSKDLEEHSHVCNHIETNLKNLGIKFSDELRDKEILRLPFVQHLYKNFQGEISPNITDMEIITALHPTPAVSGVSVSWAISLIRELEGFDRGFYSGLIGFLGSDESEFAVAIRSALTHENNMFIYAACGIVADSIPELEWYELDHKEKAMLAAIEYSGNQNE